MSKVLMIGIDSLDKVLLGRFQKNLPNFTRLRKESPAIEAKSVQPPDSVTAWASIYTGLNPARHGMVYFKDPLDKVSATVCEEIDNSSLQGNTFWDLAGRCGKKVCILFPHIGYPVWPVNGLMLGRSSMRGRVQTFPQSISAKYEVSHLNTLRGLPTGERSYRKYIEKGRELILAEFEFALKIFKEQEWDLFFLYSSVMDWISHNFWNYFDEEDPSYPGENPFKDVIKDFYILYDGMIGKIIARIQPGTAIILLSDHGHGRRPTKLVNINEILRKKGFLVPRIKKPRLTDPQYLLEAVKRILANFVNRCSWTRNLAMGTLHYFGSFRKMYTSPSSIDWQKTLAFSSDLSGIKAYNYGGVVIRKENLDNVEYEELRSLLIEELSKIKEPKSSKKLVKSILPREELYRGKYLSRYPDVVLDLIDDYGVGWSIYCPLISECTTHNIQPGSHKADSPVFLISKFGDKKTVSKTVTLMDIAPTVLDLLGVEGNFSFDGKSIFKESEQFKISHRSRK